MAIKTPLALTWDQYINRDEKPIINDSKNQEYFVDRALRQEQDGVATQGKTKYRRGVVIKNDMGQSVASKREDISRIADEVSRLNANADNDRVSKVDQEEYAGSDRPEYVPEKISYIPLKQDNPITPKGLVSGLTENEAAILTYKDAVERLNGPNALSYMREIAAQANKAAIKAREDGNDGIIAIVSPYNSASAVIGELAKVSLELYPETTAAALAKQSSFNPHHEQSAVKTVMDAKARGLDKPREGFQVLPNDIKDVPVAQILDRIKKFDVQRDQRTHPDTIAQILVPANLIKEDPEKPNKITDLVDDVASKMSEKTKAALIKHGNSNIRFASAKINPNDLKGVVDNPRPITRSFLLLSDRDPNSIAKAQEIYKNAKETEEVVVGTSKDRFKGISTKARVSQMGYPDENMGVYLKSGMPTAQAEYIAGNTPGARETDETIMVLGPNPHPVYLQLMGEAAMAGKLGDVYIDGKLLDPLEASALGKANYTSKSQLARRSMAQGLDIETSDPVAAMALSMIHGDDKRAINERRISNADIRAIAKVEGTILDVVEMASDPDTAKTLKKDFGISSSALRLLQDEKALADAGRNIDNNFQILNQQRIEVISGSDFPESIQGSKNAPAFGLLMGDPEEFKSIKNLVFVVGEPLIANSDEEIKKAQKLGEKASDFIESLEGTDARIATIYGALPAGHIPRKGDLVAVAGAVGSRMTDAMSNDLSELSERGVLILSVNTAIEREVRVQGRGKKYENILTQNSPHESFEPEIARVLGEMADLTAVMNGKKMGRSAVTEAIAGSIEKGKRVAVLDPIAQDISPVTHALVNKSGRRALRDAGVNESSISPSALDAVEGGKVSMILGSNPQKAAQAVADWVKPKTQVAQQERQASKSKTSSQNQERD